jgi:hypothetical protein
VDAADGAEEEAVSGHGVEDAGAGDHHAVEAAGGGSEDERGDPELAGATEHHARGVGGDRFGGRYAVNGEQVDVGGVDGQNRS